VNNRDVKGTFAVGAAAAGEVDKQTFSKVERLTPVLKSERDALELVKVLLEVARYVHAPVIRKVSKRLK